MTAGADALDPAAFAELLCDYCLELSPGDQVVISSTTLATPLLLECHRAALEREAWPLLRVELSGQTEAFYSHARDSQLDGFAPLELAEASGAERRLGIRAPANTRALADVDPERIARATRARQPLVQARRPHPWCLTLWPTEALAQQAGMGLRDYTAFVRRALFLDRPDAAGAWVDLRVQQQQLVDRLSTARELRIQAPDTDLRLEVTGRTWVNSDGKRNMPSGEVFTGPLEATANGQIYFALASGPSGVDVSEVRLRFADGEVVEAQAERGQSYLEQMLATDEGARRLGEIGIGTNFGIDRATGQILLDEKIGGTVHLALGRSYPETGGVNSSAVHWDLICDLRDGGSLTADGEIIQQDGRFSW